MATLPENSRDVTKTEAVNTIHPADKATTEEHEVAKPTTAEDHVDAGLDAYVQALQLEPEHLERLAKSVRRKLDFILLPLMCGVYIVAYMEKASLNYANAFSLQKDLGLQGLQYSWTVAISALGLMLGSYPSSLAIQKRPVGKLMSMLIFTWCLFSMCPADAQNFGVIFALRFLLGLAESAIAPAFLVLVSMLWTRDEQPLRMCIYLGCSGLADIIGVGIALALGSVTSTTIDPWQLIFLVIGSIAVVLSGVCFYILPSSPSDARFLSEDKKIAAVWRIARNQTGIKHPKVLKYQIREALCDIRVYRLLVQQFAIGMANGGLGGYYSALLRGFGWSSIQTIRCQLPIGAVQLVASVIAGYLASRYRNRTIIIVLVLAMFSITAMVGFSTIPIEQKMALTACTWIVSAGGGAIGAIVLNWAIVAANFAGHSKRTTVNGINFVAYWSGNFAGPFLFDPHEAPRYHSATAVLGAMLGVGWVATACMGVYMWNANRRRDAKAAAGRHEYVAAAQGGIEGFTDKENKSFRYRY